MKKLLYISFLLFTGFMLSCKKDSQVNARNGTFTEDPTIFQDQFGRQLILHGLNTSSSAKGDPQRLPWIQESNVEREHREFGFNFVRYLILWDGIEPAKDSINYHYLDLVEERVNWYTSRGMYVMLDMHQDLYSIKYSGDGAPFWACESNGVAPISLPGGTPWWVKNIDPAVINCWVNFWGYSRYKYLQDHYIMMWTKVAERFKNNPYVLGYDLMNEPWGGDLIKTFITGDFERYQLSAFYKRLVPAMRQADPNKYIIFEPQPAPVTFGVKSNLPKISDSRSTPKLGYAPHCYPYDTHEGTGYTATSKQQLRDWERERKNDLVRQGNIPLICGEFGLSPNQNAFSDYLLDAHSMFDRNQWHWTYWSNDNGGWSPLNSDGSETSILQYLIRTYPKATQGKIKTMNFDYATKTFKMVYQANAGISMPTEIFVPTRFYPNGYNLNIFGTTKYSTSEDASIQMIKVKVNESTDVTIEITAK